MLVRRAADVEPIAVLLTWSYQWKLWDRSALNPELRRAIGTVTLPLAAPHSQERRQHVGELHWENPLGGGAGPQGLERLKVLKAHGLGINCVGYLVDVVQSAAEPLGA